MIKDVKKEMQELYSPGSKKPSFLNVPGMKFYTLTGKGDPNTSELYQKSVEALYAMSYGVRMDYKKKNKDAYVVSPLEGFWDTDDKKPFDGKDKSKLVWKICIRQPDFVTDELTEEIRSEVFKKKKNERIQDIALETIEEGECIHMLHLGPYDTEPETKAKMEKAAAAENKKLVESSHHEIYLSDPRKVAPEKL